MALTSPASFLPTMDEFIAHWTLVNAKLGANPLTISQGGVTLGTLTGLRTALLAKRALLQVKINEVQMLQADVEAKRTELLVRFNQITSRFAALVPDSRWTRALPLAPSPGAGLAVFLDAMNDVANLWAVYDLEEEGFTLPGPLTQVNFQTAVTGLLTASQALANAEAAVSLTRDDRNGLQDEVRVILRDYRQAVPSYLMPGDSLIESLPRLTPARGHTPEPVNVQGQWVAATTQGKIVWDASDEATLKKYQVRWAPGSEAEDYETGDEEILETVLPAEPREFLTTKGLLLPGDVSLFRVYVVLETDNEKGSETVVITRP